MKPQRRSPKNDLPSVQVPKAATVDPSLPQSKATTQEAPSKPAPATPAASTAATTPSSRARRATPTTSAASEPATRALTVRVPADVADRARTAWRVENAAVIDQCASFSAWVSRALEQAVMDSEKTYNKGRPYQGTPPGVIPHASHS